MGASCRKIRWVGEWQRSDEGAPINNLYNVSITLSKAPQLAGLLARDEMLRADILMKPVPDSDEPFRRTRSCRPSSGPRRPA